MMVRWFWTVLITLVFTARLPAQWKPAEGPLQTRWTQSITPDNVWPEYPRPQMVRENWTNLNGLMTYDREVVKIDFEAASEAARKLYLPTPEVDTVVPDR